MMKFKEWAGSAMLAVVVAVLVAGCASTGVKRTDNLVSSLDAAKRNLQAANVSVSNTMSTLALIQEEETVLADTYPALKKQVAEVSSAVDRVKKGNLAVQKAGKDKYDSWKAELAAVQDENLKKQSMKRMEASLKDHEDQLKMLNETEAAIDPLVTTLSDIVKCLDLDLSKEGVQNISKEIKAACASGKKVQELVAGAAEGLASK